MKKLSLILSVGIMSISVISCGSPSVAPSLNQNIQDTAISSTKKDIKPEKPVTKTKVSFKDAKFNDSDFSKFADAKAKTSYKADVFKQSTGKNDIFDSLPFRTYNDFENEIRYTNNTDYNFLDSRNGNYHFNKNYGAYDYARSIYRASNDEMKRFIEMDVLANSLAVNGYPINYNETHNPPFRPEYKLLPTRAAYLTPTFGEIYDYNRYNSGCPYIAWDMGKAASYYQANYARYMGLVMEHGPTDKYKVYDYVQREISSYAGI